MKSVVRLMGVISGCSRNNLIIFSMCPHECLVNVAKLICIQIFFYLPCFLQFVHLWCKTLCLAIHTRFNVSFPLYGYCVHCPSLSVPHGYGLSFLFTTESYPCMHTLYGNHQLAEDYGHYWKIATSGGFLFWDLIQLMVVGIFSLLLPLYGILFLY